MRRLTLALLGTLALLAALLAPTPAQAETNSQTCWNYDDGQYGTHVCLSVNWTRMQSGGIRVYAVRIYASGDLNPIFESKIEDCDNLRLWNDNQVVKWRKDDAQCDLYKSDASTTWYPDIQMTDSANAHFGWTFYPKLDKATDPGYTHVHLDLP